MTDGIIKGTGNSRFLRTVANAKTLYPTWDAALNALIQGTFPIDLNGFNSSGWNQQGTMLNKANLLSDTTASAYGKGAAATVNEILAAARSLISAAQSKADSAQSKADSAQSKADSAYSIASGIHIVAGAYTGDGAASRFINVGFSPAVVMVVQGGGLSTSIKYGGFALPGIPVMLLENPTIKIEGTGFLVSTKYHGPESNTTDWEYQYLALK